MKNSIIKVLILNLLIYLIMFSYAGCSQENRSDVPVSSDDLIITSSIADTETENIDELTSIATSEVKGTVMSTISIESERIFESTSATTSEMEKFITTDFQTPSCLTSDNTVSFVRFSDGYFNNSNNIVSSVKNPEVSYVQISEGDKIGDLIVEKIFSMYNESNGVYELTQSQIQFSGSVTLSGWLYYGKNETKSFGEAVLSENVLYFIPDSSKNNDFPLSPYCNEYFSVFDECNNFYLTTDSEPIMLGLGEFADEMVKELVFPPSQYLKAEITLQDFQIRYNLDWFVLDYESCATPIEIFVS